MCVRAHSLYACRVDAYIDVHITIMRGASEASFSHTFFVS